LFEDEQAHDRAKFEAHSARLLIDALGPIDTIPLHAQGVLAPRQPGSPPRAYTISPLRAVEPITAKPFCGLARFIERLITVTSPNGRFGSALPVFWGDLWLDGSWMDTWLEFFTRDWHMVIAAIKGSHHGNGNDELWALTDATAHHVIPRLIGALESDGRRIKPTLCHGDIHKKNVHFDNEHQRVILFDGSCFYGHWEVDLHSLYQFGATSMDSGPLREAKELLGASEPVDEFDDRNAVYGL